MSEPDEIPVPDNVAELQLLLREQRARIKKQNSENRNLRQRMKAGEPAPAEENDGTPAPPDVSEEEPAIDDAARDRALLRFLGKADVLPAHFDSVYSSLAEAATLVDGVLTVSDGDNLVPLDEAAFAKAVPAQFRRPKGAGGSGGGAPRLAGSARVAAEAGRPAPENNSQRIYERSRAAAGGGTAGAISVQERIRKEES